MREANVPRAKPRTWRGAALAEELPVARVLVDKGVLHLDRYFDYAVPEELDAEAQPGVRVRVRFGAGRHRVRDGRREGGGLIDGFLDRAARRVRLLGAAGRRSPRSSRPEPVLGAELLRTRAAPSPTGTRAASPTCCNWPCRRAAPAPRRRASPGAAARAPGPGAGHLGALRARARLPRRPGLRGAPRAVWNALPGPEWSEELARAVAATLASGRGALVVVPDGRAVARVDAALTALLGDGPPRACSPPTPDPRSGTRSGSRCGAAPYAPSSAPGPPCSRRCGTSGLVAIWDDGDDSHSEPHAPQPHAREVLLLRAAQDKCAFLLGGWSCTVEAAQLVESGWARPLAAGRDQVRRAAPAGADRRRRRPRPRRGRPRRPAAHPRLAGRSGTGCGTARCWCRCRGAGYVPRLACERVPGARAVRALRRAAPGAGAPGALRCGWCGREEHAWHCPECGGFRLRAQVVGARRTAEELGRAFPAVPVRTSGREQVLDTVPDAPALVVSTPGAEPVAEGGYAAALLLDGWAMLGRPDLRAGEEALRRWIAAAALVRPQGDGGHRGGRRRADAAARCRRWCAGTPSGYAVRELAERAELGFPPVSRMAAVSGPPEAVAEFLAAVGAAAGRRGAGPGAAAGRPCPAARAGPGAPPPGEQWERALIRVPPGSGAALAAALKTAQAARMARGERGAGRVRIDPPDIG